MLPDKPEPDRKVKSKRFITKVMFLAAVGRSRPGFDGKIGIWPFVEKVAAQRNKSYCSLVL